MAYLAHGVIIQESATSLVAPVTADSAIQIVIGTAPINMGELNDPFAPKLAYTFDEAVKKVGISRDYSKFTLMQSLVAAFEIYGIAPVVFINVLDPKKHTKTINTEECLITNGIATLSKEGVLLDGVTLITLDDQPLIKDVDYTIAFSKTGTVIIEAKKNGKLTTQTASLSATYTYLDPSMVTKMDIVDGVKKVREVYPKYNIVPGQLLAPGFSHEVEVYNALTASTQELNGMFSCVALIDVDCDTVSEYDDVNEFKNDNSFVDKNAILLWPMCRIGDSVFSFSAIAGAHIAKTDAENENVPYVSPSNHTLKISGICDGAGKEIILDNSQANLLNSQGVCTGINIGGWKYWGNRTACYPNNTDVKDMFIPIRRMFCWWGNTFILTYFQKVDNPMNKRLIESIVDSENIRAGGFVARGQIAGAHMEFLIEDNPTTDLLNGTMRFKQYLTPFPAAETIINVLEFDPDTLVQSLI